MNDRIGILMRVVKRHGPMLLTVMIVFLSSGCTGLPIAIDNGTSAGGAADGTSVAGGAKQTSTPTGLPVPPNPAANRVVAIKLGDTITVDGSGTSVEGSTVRITAGGTYKISGTLKDGQIIVDTQEKRKVNLFLDGADITCASSAPIYIRRAKTTVITLADGTENHVTDGHYYKLEDPAAKEPNAAIFSKGNLTFDGNGSLTVEANYHNGITSKDQLNITGGNITVNAANDGIKGRDYIAINDGNITVNSKADGMQSNNSVDPEFGFVDIEGGTINITAEKDGIQAATSVVINGGEITASSGGGSGNEGNTLGSLGGRNQPPAKGAVSTKGIKAVTGIKIEGGTIALDSAEDALHSDGLITIDNGNIVLAAGNNAMHADSNLTVNGGDITVTRSYEAMEGAVIAINGGNVHLDSRDDGINVAGGSQRANGKPGGPDLTPDKHLTIDGGYIVVDASGDGIDVNGWAKITGGTIVVNGPSGDQDGALDYEREFAMAGGTLVGVGASGMNQTPDATSTQYSLALNLESRQPAGTLVHIEAEDGTQILTFAPLKEYQALVYSSPELKRGSTYNVYIGGSSTGSAVDGVYSGGSYTPGTRTASLNLRDMVTR